MVGLVSILPEAQSPGLCGLKFSHSTSLPPVSELVSALLGAEGWCGWWGALDSNRTVTHSVFDPVTSWALLSSSVKDTAQLRWGSRPSAWLTAGPGDALLGGHPVHGRCSAASVAPVHSMPVACFLSSFLPTKDVSRHCRMSPGGTLIPGGEPLG